MGDLKSGSAALEALSGKMSMAENDEAVATRKGHPPMRRSAQCRNHAVDRGFGSLAMSVNLEECVSCELGNGYFTKARQILTSIYEYLS